MRVGVAMGGGSAYRMMSYSLMNDAIFMFCLTQSSSSICLHFHQRQKFALMCTAQNDRFHV